MRGYPLLNNLKDISYAWRGMKTTEKSVLMLFGSASEVGLKGSCRAWRDHGPRTPAHPPGQRQVVDPRECTSLLSNHKNNTTQGENSNWKPSKLPSSYPRSQNWHHSPPQYTPKLDTFGSLNHQHRAAVSVAVQQFETQRGEGRKKRFPRRYLIWTGRPTAPRGAEEQVTGGSSTKKAGQVS